MVGMAQEFDRSVQALARALGSALVLALAFSTVVWSALSLKLGKRPVRIAPSPTLLPVLTLFCVCVRIYMSLYQLSDSGLAMFCFVSIIYLASIAGIPLIFSMMPDEIGLFFRELHDK